MSDCDQRLAAIATIELLPRLIGPGDCGGRDMIRLDAVLLPNRKRVEVGPTAILRCAAANPLLPGSETRPPITSPRLGTRCAPLIPSVRTSAAAVTALPTPN